MVNISSINSPSLCEHPVCFGVLSPQYSYKLQLLLRKLTYRHLVVEPKIPINYVYWVAADIISGFSLFGLMRNIKLSEPVLQEALPTLDTNLCPT